MKTFNQFKQIAYKMAKPHKVYNKNNKVTNVGAGRAMAKRSSSSAGGDGGDGSGDGGDGD